MRATCAAPNAAGQRLELGLPEQKLVPINFGHTARCQQTQEADDPGLIQEKTGQKCTIGALPATVARLMSP